MKERHVTAPDAYRSQKLPSAVHVAQKRPVICSECTATAGRGPSSQGRRRRPVRGRLRRPLRFMQLTSSHRVVVHCAFFLPVLPTHAARRRAQRPLRGLGSVRASPARRGNAARLLRRRGGLPRGLRLSTCRRWAGHRRWVIPSGLTPSPLPGAVVHVHVHGANVALRAQARARRGRHNRSPTVTARGTAPVLAAGARPERWPAISRPTRPGCGPRPAHRLHRPPSAGMLAQPVVDPAAAHAASGHERGNCCVSLRRAGRAAGA